MKKAQRLTGKDIAYMLKRGKKLSGTYFFGYTIAQHPRRLYHQRNIHVSTKIDKRSTQRNYLKRYLNEQWGSCMAVVPYAKTFLMIHKHQYLRLQQLIATRNKKAIRELVDQRCTHDFSVFAQHLCRPSSDRSGTGTTHSAKALIK